jgi:hypothetical protein
MLLAELNLSAATGIQNNRHSGKFVAGIQRLKSLDPGYKHAGMTTKWDSNG